MLANAEQADANTGGTDAFALGNFFGRVAVQRFFEQRAVLGDEHVRPGGEGELCITGRGVMQGYWSLPEQTANAYFVGDDGRRWIDWRADAGRLSLSDYWRTPRDEALFLGAYDCRYRYSRVTLTPLVGEGHSLEPVEP